jgi:phosphoribosylanthranilate isomerase
MKKFAIKVCGMREKNNIAQLVKLPIDYIGFIFYPHSPRYVGENIDKAILEIIPEKIKKVGVFVNRPIKEVIRIAQENQLQCIQLHGNEIPDYCNVIKDEGYTVIKAFKAEPELLTCETANYRFAADYFLFDTPTAGFGGSGQKFDWQMLMQQKLYVPFFLSGGISLDDVANIKNLQIPGLFALDINSRFETGPGMKDVEKIKQFIEALN